MDKKIYEWQYKIVKDPLWLVLHSLFYMISLSINHKDKNKHPTTSNNNYIYQILYRSYTIV